MPVRLQALPQQRYVSLSGTSGMLQSSSCSGVLGHRCQGVVHTARSGCRARRRRVECLVTGLLGVEADLRSDSARLLVATKTWLLCGASRSSIAARGRGCCHRLPKRLRRREPRRSPWSVARRWCVLAEQEQLERRAFGSPLAGGAGCHPSWMRAFSGRAGETLRGNYWCGPSTVSDDRMWRVVAPLVRATYRFVAVSNRSASRTTHESNSRPLMRPG